MKKILTGLTAAVLICSIIGALTPYNRKSITEARCLTNDMENISQKELSCRVIRLHVLANSDGADDQTVKHEIKNMLLSEYGDLFAGSDGIQDASKNASDALKEIYEDVNAKLAENGFDYGCSASLCTSFFPDRTYGEALFFPQGDYSALKIVLGDGQGQNWWCVLYPPLCFLNIKEEDASSEEYDGKIKVKWKLAELLQRYLEEK